MRALLGRLLGSEIDSRPATAKMLKEEIEAVIAGAPVEQPPYVESLQASAKEKVGFWQRVKERLTSKKAPENAPQTKQKRDEWCRAVGEVRSISSNGELEYTFEVDGRLWAGRYPGAEKEKKRKTPWDCEVYYNAVDPSRNRLLSENEIKAIDNGKYAAEVNERDKDGKTPLMKAKTKKEVYLLLEKGADPNAKDKKVNMNRPVLSYFIDQPEIFQLLLEKGADPNVKIGENQWPLLTFREVIKDINLIKMLIEAGADVNAKTKAGDPILLYGAIYDNPKFAKILIEAGADVNAKESDGDPILSYKCVLENPELIWILVNAGADVNAPGPNNYPILSTKSAIDHPESFKTLIVLGANVNAKLPDGTPLLLNKNIRNSPKYIKMLIDAGADVNAKDNNGKPLLLHFVEQPDIYQWMLKRGAAIG